jgi:glyoxylase-like metal-dependent hydrolase (beta-lactamase superfamily II)
MRVTTHGSNLTQLIRLPSIFPANCYLVREGTALTLIDTALPGSATGILSAARKLDLPITRIVLTHAHMDHVGSLDDLRRALPNAEVLISERDARFLAGDRRLDPGEEPQKLRGSWKTCTTTPTGFIKHGDRVGSLRVIASPGHTPGHVAFFDTRDGTLIAGDAFQTRAGIAVAGVARPLFPFVAMGTWSREIALASAVTLRDLGPSRLATGHGNVLEAPAEAMEGAIAVARRKTARVAPHGA